MAAGALRLGGRRAATGVVGVLRSSGRGGKARPTITLTVTLPILQALTWCVEHGVAKSDAHAKELWEKYKALGGKAAKRK